MVTLAEKCKYIRHRLGFTQYDIAALISTNQTEVSFIERGFIPEDVKKINKINDLWSHLVEEDGSLEF